MINPPATSHRRFPWAVRRQSISTQLVLWNIAALALLLGLLGGVTRYAVLGTIMASVDRELDARTHPPGGPPPGRFPTPNGPPPDDAGAPGGGNSNPPGPMDQLGGGPPMYGGPPDRPAFGNGPGGAPSGSPDRYRPRRFDLTGHSLAPGSNLTPWDMPGFEEAKHGAVAYDTVTVDGEQLRVMSHPVPDHGPIKGVVQGAYPLADVNRSMAGLDRVLLTLIPIALLCAGLAGAGLTGRVLRRVRSMTHAAGRIGARDFSERIPVTGEDEFSDLATTFNGLLGRLESALEQQKRLTEQQRRFTADASHELKTPLTIIKGNTSMALGGQLSESGYRETLTEIDEATESMSHLVRDLLLLARSDGGQLGQDSIELLLREVLERAISRAPRQSPIPIRLAVEDETLSVIGNEDELTRVFSNILVNAIRHTPPDGCITVAIRRDGADVLVTIADTGIGIAAEHLPHLGERFYRVDSSRSRPDGGTGLGLSICKSILDAHHGRMAFASKVGVGTTVTVTLPAAE